MSIQTNVPSQTVATRWLTVPQVQQALQLSRSAVYAMIQRGDIQAQRFGRSIRVQAEALSKAVTA